MDVKPLTETSAKSLLKAINPAVKEVVLKELLAEKSERDKIILYETLAEEIYGGIHLSENYSYGIFPICPINGLLHDDDFLHRLYGYADNELYMEQVLNQCDIQIMFIDGGENCNFDDVRFNCARASSKPPMMPRRNKYHIYQEGWREHLDLIVEHPEARQLYEILNAKKRKNGRSMTAKSVVIRFGAGLFTDQWEHVLIKEITKEEVKDSDDEDDGGIDGTSKYNIDKIAEEVSIVNRCDNRWGPEHHYQVEFTIIFNTRRCHVSFWEFLCTRRH